MEQRAYDERIEAEEERGKGKGKTAMAVAMEEQGTRVSVAEREHWERPPFSPFDITTHLLPDSSNSREPTTALSPSVTPSPAPPSPVSRSPSSPGQRCPTQRPAPTTPPRPRKPLSSSGGKLLRATRPLPRRARARIEESHPPRRTSRRRGGFRERMERGGCLESGWSRV